jgi:hypothetical protein
MAATPSGKGYWLVTAGGGVHCFGDAKPHGSTPRRARHLSKPIVVDGRDAVGEGLLAGDVGRGVFASATPTSIRAT